MPAGGGSLPSRNTINTLPATPEKKHRKYNKVKIERGKIKNQKTVCAQILLAWAHNCLTPTIIIGQIIC